MLGPLNIAARQRGLSLVELMIGLAIGLFIVAAAATLLVARLQEHRASLLEARLTQDLRACADLVTRDLRRAGYWGDATAAMSASDGASSVANPYAALTVSTPSAAASEVVGFRFSRDATENNLLDANEQFGFRLRNGVIEMQLGSGSWQAMTDPATMTVTAFGVVPATQEIDLEGVCDKPCPASAVACGPKQQIRSLAVVITARANADPRLVRSVRDAVRLRNDAIAGRCPA